MLYIKHTSSLSQIDKNQLSSFGTRDQHTRDTLHPHTIDKRKSGGSRSNDRGNKGGGWW